MDSIGTSKRHFLAANEFPHYYARERLAFTVRYCFQLIGSRMPHSACDEFRNFIYVIPGIILNFCTILHVRSCVENIRGFSFQTCVIRVELIGLHTLLCNRVEMVPPSNLIHGRVFVSISCQSVWYNLGDVN